MSLYLIFLSFFFGSFPVFAANEFVTKEKISYMVDTSGNASVNQEIELTNQLPDIYAKEYQVTLSGNNISQITAADKLGDILNKVEQNADSTNINLRFNQAAIGKNQTIKFNLRYLIKEFALSKGNTWDISLPEYKNINTLDELNAIIKVPLQFGKLTYSSLPLSTLRYNETENQIILIKNQLSSKTLFVFGNYQIFDFNLTYYLENPSSSLLKTEIAIPPDTDTQLVTYQILDPLPQNITVDEDGNWLAQYLLPPQQILSVNALGQVKIFPSSRQINQNIDLSKLTSPQPYWPADDPKIKQISASLSNPKEIFDYVVATLSYDYSLINTNPTRQGALAALNSPNKALCTEFSDLFVTLARAKGIPAREIEGFAYTNNPKIKPLNLNADILHAWPQYYHSGKNTWISVDPTWTKTTNGINYFNDLDLNHLTFVIHGKDSQYPPPPGSYKSDQDVKTISVDFAKSETRPEFLALKLKSDRYQLIVSNPNGTSQTNILITLDGSNWSHSINLLPPFSSTVIDLPSMSFIASLLPQNQQLPFRIQDYQYSLKYYPHFLNLSLIIALSMIILSIGGIILVTRTTHAKNT